MPTTSAIRKPGFIVAAIVISVVLIIGIVGVVLSGRDSGSAEATPGVSGTTEAPDGELGDSVCGLSGVERSGTVTKAPETNWDSYWQAMAYPTSSQFGPVTTGPEGIRTCYQHSPTGALFMAANTTVSSLGGGAQWRALTVESTRAGSNDELSGSYQDALETNQLETYRASIRGFRMLSYSERAAQVEIVVRLDTYNSTYGALVIPLVWDRGDWLMDGGAAQTPQATRVADLSGYVGWTPSA